MSKPPVPDPLSTAPDAVIARLDPRGPRRIAGTAVLAALAALVLYLALAHPPSGIGWRLFLTAFGLAALWLTVRLWQATSVVLELTATELREAGGRRLALLSEVQGIDRGLFAFKPSNGFVLTLATSAPNVWAPGLWWRIGRRVGVGGMTPRNASRYMAEAIVQIVSARGIEA